MRILATADLHGRPEAYDWLESEVRKSGVDALVLAGDLLGIPDGFDTVEEAQRSDARWIRSRLGALPVPVLYVMGNDDWVNLDSLSSRLLSLHLKRVEVRGFSFVGYSCTLPFMGGPLEKPEFEQEQELQRIAPWLDERTVVVTHGPARGVLDLGILDVSTGSAALAGLLSRHPFLLHVHGHVHGCFGRNGRHLNVAAGGKGRGMLVDLNRLDAVVVGSE